MVKLKTGKISEDEGSIIVAAHRAGSDNKLIAKAFNRSEKAIAKFLDSHEQIQVPNESVTKDPTIAGWTRQETL